MYERAGLKWPKSRVRSQDMFYFLPTKVITYFLPFGNEGPPPAPLVLILQRLSFKGRDLFSKIYKVEVFNFLASVGLKDTTLRLRGPDTIPNIHRSSFTLIF